MKVAKKARTVMDYIHMGFYLGKDLRSTIVLSTSLFLYKIRPKSLNPVIHQVRIRNLAFPIYIRYEDISLVREIFWREQYWFEAMRNVDFSVVLDLGAHIGLFTLWIKSKYPNVVVHCYEPDPGNFQLLERNVSTMKDVVLHQEAVGAFSSEAKFYIDPRRHALSSLKESSGKLAIPVVIKALDDIIATLGRVDLLKFDIEGIEYEVFSRSLKIQDVPCLVGEVHGKTVDIHRFMNLFPDYCKHINRLFT